MFKYDVLCIGSATVDQFLEIKDPLDSINVGDKILVNKMETHSGGGATNAAAALSKLGLKVKLLTKLGKDHNADFIMKDLKQFKVKNLCKNSSKESTDFSTLISSEENRDRVIYVHKGASTDLRVSDIKKSQLNAKWFYLASLVGKSLETGLKLSQYAKQKGIKLLFNPSLYLAKEGKKKLAPILENTTLLVLNIEEAQALLDTKTGKIKDLAQKLCKLGPKAAVITDGKEKMCAYYNKEFYYLQPPDVNIVHTAGAGDAFTAGLLFGGIKGYPFADALSIGQANSSSVIQAVGTKNGLLNKHGAEEMVKELKIKVT